ncbi:uncharacterized protein LOC119568479 [Penaeus monodon]|uniref:uncharacterized protein LOC119568479 n=1 Tax=Penaeus monodon TaxID=6687 RepID=UPI0018A77555|nr:uncharacterized protein LOC119568479 [Penaeus monodon]
MGPPTPGGMSSAGEMSGVESPKEFNTSFMEHLKRRRGTPMIGATMDFRYQECTARNNKSKSVILATKYHKKIVENSASQLIRYLKSLQETDDEIEMKFWEGQFRKYSSKSILKNGDIRLCQFVKYWNKGESKELSSGTLERKRYQKQTESHERRKYSHVSTRRSNESDELSSESEVSQGLLKKQLTGLPKKNDWSNNTHTEATARDYLNNSHIFVKPKGKDINGNSHNICYELPLTKWPYIPKDNKGHSYVPEGLEQPRRGSQLEIFIYSCLSNISDKVEYDRKEKYVKTLRTKVLKKSIRSIERRENKECQDPITVNEIIASQDITNRCRRTTS